MKPKRMDERTDIYTNSNELQLKVERSVICCVSRATLQGYFGIDVINVFGKISHSLFGYLFYPALPLLSPFLLLPRIEHLKFVRRENELKYDESQTTCLSSMPIGRTNTKSQSVSKLCSHNVSSYLLYSCKMCILYTTTHTQCFSAIECDLLYCVVFAFGMFQTKVIVSN